jgi:hypothetical protein
MPMTSAEKTRRYRAHRIGDHSLCDPSRRCEAVEAVIRAEVDASPGPERGDRAQALWDEWAERVQGNVLAGIYLDEACRSLDRIDRLRANGEPAAMTEARHQATAMKSMLSEVRKELGLPLPTAKAAAKTPPAPDDDLDDEGGEVADRDDFASRLAARRAKASAG